MIEMSIALEWSSNPPKWETALESCLDERGFDLSFLWKQLVVDLVC
jgi:hypothetical protein